jgi:GUN4-like
VKFIPDQDLQTIDALWKAASGGKFGYSVQKEVWMQQSKYWSRFFKKIDWTQVRRVLFRQRQLMFQVVTKWLVLWCWPSIISAPVCVENRGNCTTAGREQQLQEMADGFHVHS